MKFDTSGAPHIPAINSVQRIMSLALIALAPGVLAHVWFFGPGILFQILIAGIFAVTFEGLMLKLRKRPLQPYISDYSAPITAVLFALCLPPLIPWWITLTGMLFAIVIAKHLYGGLGYNLFNPAMVGFAVVLIAFPQEATRWLPPSGITTESLSLFETLSAILTGHLPDRLTWDTITQATPLDLIRTGARQNIMLSEIHYNPVFGDFGGVGWEWIANAYLLGGLFLINRKVISWHVPAGMLGAVIILSLPFCLIDPDSHPFPTSHIFSGGMMLGAFFIATDPVSGSTTPRGRILFGAGVGALTLVIRRWGSYPDGIAFAVLMMNMAVPLLDRYTKPRVYGHDK